MFTPHPCASGALVLLASLALSGAANASPSPGVADPAREALLDPDVWPQWRGPTRDGRFGGEAWPESLAADRLTPLWRVELGHGYSSPVVALDRVFTVETRDRREEVVRAFDRQTGKELWSTAWEGAMKVPFFAAKNGSWVRSTPAWDGTRLYVAGMRDVLVCLEGDSGEIVWKVDFTERFSTALPAFGFVCSPLVVGDHVYVQAGAAFVKLDKETGATVWRSLDDSGGMNGSAFSSPVLAEIGGREQLVVQTRTDLAGVDSKTGAELWKQPIRAFRGMNILTPTVVGDAVFTSAYGGRGQLMTVAQQPGGDWSVTETWNNRAQGYMTSPVVIEGHAYLFLRSNRFTCFDLATGETTWTSPPTGDEYWSLVAQGNRILALTDGGRLLLLEANPAEYVVLDEAEIADQPTWAHLALAGREIFVRELEGLSVFLWD